LVLLIMAAGCKQEQAPPSATAPENGRATRAVAKLLPTEGSQVSGTVTFLGRNGEVEVTADLEGLKPGRHGFHIHEHGDCSAADATSAGGHFNPAGAPHGAPADPAERRHVGDLGNVEADADGRAHLEMVDTVIALEGENGIVGKAVIVHAQPDDLTTQPTGNAGPRLACGVIEFQTEP
jgi:Cu-Zn family superoxide dismutase